MKSILDNRPELAHEVNKVAEVAGYLYAFSVKVKKRFHEE